MQQTNLWVGSGTKDHGCFGLDIDFNHTAKIALVHCVATTWEQNRKVIKMAENKGGCLGWVLLMIGFIPGIIIAMKLPESLQFIGFVASIVALVFCCIMAMVNKKPEFEDETFGHACKRFMWGGLASIALGIAIALGFTLFGDKNQISSTSAEPQVNEQTDAVKQ